MTFIRCKRLTFEIYSKPTFDTYNCTPFKRTSSATLSQLRLPFIKNDFGNLDSRVYITQICCMPCPFLMNINGIPVSNRAIGIKRERKKRKGDRRRKKRKKKKKGKGTLTASCNLHLFRNKFLLFGRLTTRLTLDI